MTISTVGTPGQNEITGKDPTLGPQAREDVYRWAVVTALDPLRIRLDGDTDELPITPDSLAATLDVDDRVWVQMFGRRVIIIGSAGGSASSSLPVGAVQMWAGPATGFGAPYEIVEGWLQCRGQDVSRDDYADLFDVIGETFGVGDGSTTFTIPDYRDRFPVGVSGTHTRGGTGGESEHTLVTAEMPSHTHGSAGGHTHSVPSRANAGSFGAQSRAAESGGAAGSTPNFDTDNPGGHTHNAAGSGDPHENEPPWLGIHFIIKYTAGASGGGGGGGGVTDHGALTGLADDDHPQYLTEAEADALYSLLAHTHASDNFTRTANTGITTASIADDAEDTGTVDLAASYRLMQFTSDRACRLRLYASSAQRTADAARAIGTDVTPDTDHGLVFEYVAGGARDVMLSPLVDGFCPSGTTVYWSVTNLSGSTAVVDIDLDWIRTE